LSQIFTFSTKDPSKEYDESIRKLINVSKSLEDCLVKYANFKPNKKSKSKLKSGKKSATEDNTKNFRLLIDKILEFNEAYKKKKIEKWAERRNIKCKKKRKSDGEYYEDQESLRDEALIKIEEDENGDSQDGSYHSVLEKNCNFSFLFLLKTKLVIRSDGPYLIRLRKPPSKENEGNESKKVGQAVGGDDFNRDVQQATSMMVNLIDNNKVNFFL
jgi:hypothetical protein